MAPCPHGFATAASCLDCIEDEGLGAAPASPEKITHAFTARYDSQCTACDLPIVPGAAVASTTNDRTIHAACALGMEVDS